MNKQPMSGFALFIATFALSLGTFMQILDTSITNVAIPTIAGNLAVSSDDGAWVITSFMISNAIVLPLTGWLSDRIGSVRLFCWSTSLFSITSWMCGLATSLPQLMFYRILQGATSGVLIPLSQSLLIQIYPAEKKGQALGIWTMIVAASPAVGPVLGGWIAFDYSWQWIFYINVPVGFFSSFLAYYSLKNRESERKQSPIDLPGLLLLILAVGTMQVMLDRGNDWDWFRSPKIRILTTISAIAYVYFIVWELTTDHPVVDFSFFKNKNFLFSSLTMSVAYFIFFGILVTQPLWLQDYNGYTPLMAGIATAPLGIFPFLFCAPLGKLIGKIQLRYMVTMAFLIFAYSYFASAYFTPTVTLTQLLWQRFIQGIGIALWFPPLTALSIIGIPDNRLPSANGLFTFLRMVAGGGIGTSLFVTLFSRRTIFHHARLTETTTSYNPWTTTYYQDLTQHHITGQKANAFLNTVVNQQAAMLSINDVFWMAGWLILLTIPLIWLCKEQQTYPLTHLRDAAPQTPR